MSATNRSRPKPLVPRVLAALAVLTTAGTLLRAAPEVAERREPPERPPAAAGSKNGAADGKRIIYTPPPDAEAGTRVNGTARGEAGQFPALFVLSPDHTGLTVQEQPSVFWYLSKPAKHKFMLTVTQDGEPEPLLEVDLDGGHPGIGRLNLGKHGLKLEKGVSYQVSLALVADPKRRAQDLYSSGMIKRLDPPQALLAKLRSRPDPVDRAIAYARQGIWYDALSLLSDRIESEPADAPALREQRAALLEQVGLAEAASYDRAAAAGEEAAEPSGDQ